MDKKQLQDWANERPKNLKTPEELSKFEQLLKNISVETVLNTEMTHITKTVSTSKKTTPKQYSPELHSEALKLAERIGCCGSP